MSGMSDLLTSNIQVIWQTGSRYYHEIIRQVTATMMKKVKIVDFISRMDLAYASADLVISRAGAGTISELCLVAKQAILIPSPNVAEDHQTKNARALVDMNAAKMVTDLDAPNQLILLTLNLINDDQALHDLSNQISKLAIRNSAIRIADEVLEMIK
jgi:UDP-N-acetylglucosamine--N-acetylmuramyl-(pentapeptide) pyrophosphoryl-undecaprenol N-acetylglucosamine transferase